MIPIPNPPTVPTKLYNHTSYSNPKIFITNKISKLLFKFIVEEIGRYSIKYFIFAQELNSQYDAVGNLVTGDNFYREYDGFNHLIRIRSGNSSSGNISEEFIWHPTEERVFIKKIYWNNQTLRTTVKYLNKNTIKIKNESGTFYENYIYQDDILVAQRDANGNKQAIHNDHLGSVSLITDSSGNITENSFFSPFGEQIVPVMSSRYSFTGKEFDSVSNEYDFVSRRSKPEWANRLTTPDRIFYDFTKYEKERTISYYDPQGLNPYAYARNNPYRFIDKEGNQYFEWGQALGKGGVIGVIIALVLLTVYFIKGDIGHDSEQTFREQKTLQELPPDYANQVTQQEETEEYGKIFEEGTYVPPAAIEEVCRLSITACEDNKRTRGKDSKPKDIDLNTYITSTKSDDELKKGILGSKSYRSRGGGVYYIVNDKGQIEAVPATPGESKQESIDKHKKDKNEDNKK